MKKIFLAIFLLTYISYGKYTATINKISPTIKKRMIKGNSWKRGCPVGLRDLRYLRMSYIDFRGRTKIGEMIVHKDVAKSVTHIFEDLYNMDYPINKMRLVSDYRGKDWQSIEADNTSALNCRAITGNSKKWSNHAYGKAIDINPIANPYISRKGRISHKASLKYRKRVHRNRSAGDRAMLLKNDKATKIFKDFGWKWGGDWRSIKDYQHFEYTRKSKSKTRQPQRDRGNLY
ncbi:MAG: M15 family metallopeptidase [Sulfurovum sp.]